MLCVNLIWAKISLFAIFANINWFILSIGVNSIVYIVYSVLIYSMYMHNYFTVDTVGMYVHTYILEFNTL